MSADRVYNAFGAGTWRRAAARAPPTAIPDHDHASQRLSTQCAAFIHLTATFDVSQMTTQPLSCSCIRRPRDDGPRTGRVARGAPRTRNTARRHRDASASRGVMSARCRAPARECRTRGRAGSPHVGGACCVFRGHSVDHAAIKSARSARSPSRPPAARRLFPSCRRSRKADYPATSWTTGMALRRPRARRPLS